jgi:hypothetical protein
MPIDPGLTVQIDGRGLDPAILIDQLAKAWIETEVWAESRGVV